MLYTRGPNVYEFLSCRRAWSLIGSLNCRMRGVCQGVDALSSPLSSRSITMGRPKGVKEVPEETQNAIKIFLEAAHSNRDVPGWLKQPLSTFPPSRRECGAGDRRRPAPALAVRPS